MQRHQARTGFTLIEAILVLSIVAIVTAIGLPRLDALRHQSDAGVLQVRALLQQAQRDAIVRQHDLMVSFDTIGRRLILSYDRNNDGVVATTERIRVQTLPEEARFGDPVTPIPGSLLEDFGAIRAASLKTVANMPTVIFRRDGSVSSPLEIYTTSKAGRPGDLRVTRVDQATGRTSWMRFNGTSWREPR